MEQATKKKLLIGGALLVVAGVGGYFLYKFLKNKADKKRQEEEQKKLQQQQQQPPAPVTPAGTPPITDKPADVKAFQDWLDTNYPTWYKGGKLNKGSGYGTFVPSTRGAWASYKTQYLTPTTPAPTPAPTPASTPAPLKIGDRVVMSKPDFWWKENKFEAWDYIKGADNSIVSSAGKAPTGLYTGIIKSIPTTTDLITVSNSTNQPSDSYFGGGDTATFRVDKKSVVKQPEAASFDGMTVSYIQSPL